MKNSLSLADSLSLSCRAVAAEKNLQTLVFFEGVLTSEQTSALAS